MASEAPNPYATLTESQLTKLIEDIRVNTENLDAVRKAVAENLQLLNNALQSARPDRGLKVSGHAVLRYLERVRGVDLGAIEREIADAVANGRDIGGGAVVGEKRTTFIVKDGWIVTVLPRGSSTYVLRRKAA